MKHLVWDQRDDVKTSSLMSEAYLPRSVVGIFTMWSIKVGLNLIKSVSFFSPLKATV